MHRSLLTIAAAAVLTFITSTAHAGIITAVGAASLPGFSTGSLGPVGATPSPNNDNAGGAPNAIAYTIFYNTNGIGPAEYEFIVENSGGVTEYLFTGMVVNNTGVPWSHYQLELGFGRGAAFTRSSALDLLDFDTPDGTPAPTSSRFADLTHGSDFVQWSAGSVPSIGVMFLSFRIDVPDNLSTWHPSGLSRFTVRQQPGIGDVPSVPEPGILTLLGAGLLGAGRFRRRRLRAWAEY